MKVNIQNYTKNRPTWMLFEFNGRQMGPAFDYAKAGNPGLIFMNHSFDEYIETRRLLKIKIIYL